MPCQKFQLMSSIHWYSVSYLWFVTSQEFVYSLQNSLNTVGNRLDLSHEKIRSSILNYCPLTATAIAPFRKYSLINLIWTKYHFWLSMSFFTIPCWLTVDVQKKHFLKVKRATQRSGSTWRCSFFGTTTFTI